MPAPRRNAAAPSARLSVVDVFRRAVEQSGRSEYAISTRAGKARSCLSDFMSGRRGMTLDTFAALCEELGLVLVVDGRRGGSRRTVREAGRGKRGAKAPVSSRTPHPAPRTPIPVTPPADSPREEERSAGDVGSATDVAERAAAGEF